MPVKETNILIIDDSMEDVNLILEIFKRANLEKIHIQYANNLSFSLKLLNKNKFDVIILDLGLPDCVGFESIRKLRKNHPHIPIIVLTGFDEELKEKALELGVQSYLSKGKTDAQTLIRTINSTVMV